MRKGQEDKKKERDLC